MEKKKRSRSPTLISHHLSLLQPELARLLYPLFVHTYLELVSRGHPGEAAALLARHQARFGGDASRGGGGAGASRARAAELAALQAVTTPDAVGTDRVAAAARSARHPLTLCGHSFDLVMAYLRRAGGGGAGGGGAGPGGLMLSLINDRLALHVVDGQPLSAAAAAASEKPALAAGALATDAAAVNAGALSLNRLADPAVERVVAERIAGSAVGDMLAAGEGAALPDTDAEGRPLTKKAKAQLLRDVAAERARRARVAANCLSPSIPLPPLDEASLADEVDALRARAPVSPTHLPSAAAFTFVNTHRALCCAAIADDASFVLGGFADASVRLYDVAAAAAAGARTREWAATAAAARAAGEPAQPPPGGGEEGGGGGGGGGEGGNPPLPPPVTILRGHAGPVYGVDFLGAPPGAPIALSASGDGTLRAWSTDARAALAVYREHAWPVWGVAACPRGLYFASASADRTARVWSTERSSALRVLAGHTSDVIAVAWHPNCHYLATGSDDATARLWDVREGVASRVLVGGTAGHTAPVTALAFSPDGTALATGDEDGRVVVWDLRAARPRAAAPGGHAGHAVWSLAYARGAADGGTTAPVLASGGGDDTVRLWDASGSLAAAKAAEAAAAAAARAAAAAARGEGGGGGAGDGAGAAEATAAGPSVPALPQLAVWPTKATPPVALNFSSRNLLLAAGALSLGRR